MATDTTAAARTRSQTITGIVQAWLPVLTVVGGALWGLYTYLDHQKGAQRDAARQSEQEATTRRIEAQKPFLEKQLALYFEAAQVAGKLTTLKPAEDGWDANERRFWQLYWSELSMVESAAVEAAMVRLRTALDNYKRTPGDSALIEALDEAVYELAHAIRASIESAWTGR